MRYELSGAAQDKWKGASFDAVGDAISAAMDGLADGWKQVTITGDDGSRLNERQIRDLHALIQSGAMRA